MNVQEQPETTASDAPNRTHGWRTSTPRSGLGAGAWLFAVFVVVMFALGLHFLYQ